MISSVKVSEGSSFTFESPQVLFEVDLPLTGMGADPYDVTPDGQRFIAVVRVGEAESSSLKVVLNWQASLRD